MKPISFYDLKDKIAVAPEEIVAKINSMIEIAMENKQYVVKKEYDESTAEFIIILPFEVSKFEMGNIQRLFEGEGWFDMSFLNSSENHERPGLCRVTLWGKI